MSTWNRELVFLILQYLDEERFTETVHKLEKESGLFFNMRYFEDIVTNGEWEEVEKYLRGFTRVDDNRCSMKIYFEIRKQKFLEALDKGDHARAVEILSKDLKAFSTFNEDLFKEITMLLTLPNFRENERLSKYGDPKSARSIMLVELRKLIEANPRFRDKLQFPTFNDSRLRTLLNQSCGQGNVARAPSTFTNPLMGPIPIVGLPPIGGPGLFQHGPNQSSVPRRTISVGPMGLTPPNNAGIKLMRCTENGAGATSKAPVVGTFAASGSSAAGSSVSSPRGLNGDSRILPDIKSRISEELDESKMWKLTEIREKSQLRALRLSDSLLTIIQLSYTYFGGSILALAYNAVERLWTWLRSGSNQSGKVTTDVPPQIWQSSTSNFMTNDISETNLEEAGPCFALSKDESYAILASEGILTFYNMRKFEQETSPTLSTAAVTFLIFHPRLYNIFAMGMEDSVIRIYGYYEEKLNIMNESKGGHHKRITGLAFSSVLNILVSSCAGAEICVWDMEQWRLKTIGSLRIPVGRGSNSHGETRVLFHEDQRHMLIVHETQLAIYVPTPKLECVTQWVPRDPSPAITNATYSCDSQSIFSCFEDGSVLIFTAVGLKMKCRINPAAYIPSSPRSRVHPLAIAAGTPRGFILWLME